MVNSRGADMNKKGAAPLDAPGFLFLVFFTVAILTMLYLIMVVGTSGEVNQSFYHMNEVEAHRLFQQFFQSTIVLNGTTFTTEEFLGSNLEEDKKEKIKAFQEKSEQIFGPTFLFRNDPEQWKEKGWKNPQMPWQVVIVRNGQVVGTSIASLGYIAGDLNYNQGQGGCQQTIPEKHFKISNVVNGNEIYLCIKYDYMVLR